MMAETCVSLNSRLEKKKKKFRVQGAGCRVQGAGCRVQGAECRVQGTGCRLQGTDRPSVRVESAMLDRPVSRPPCVRVQNF